MTSFGPAARQRRKALGLMQKEVAKRAKMNRSHLSKIEVGSRNPKPETRRRICRALRWWPPYVLLFSVLLAGCEAISPISIDLPTRAHASRCAADQDLKQVAGVWQCVDH